MTWAPGSLIRCTDSKNAPGETVEMSDVEHFHHSHDRSAMRLLIELDPYVFDGEKPVNRHKPKHRR
jgi:hypothetical protein